MLKHMRTLLVLPALVAVAPLSAERAPITPAMHSHAATAECPYARAAAQLAEAREGQLVIVPASIERSSSESPLVDGRHVASGLYP